MSHDLTQPEEVELALRELEDEATTEGMHQHEAAHSVEDARTAWLTGYVSPYRAAHLKAAVCTGILGV